jgi:transposase
VGNLITDELGAWIENACCPNASGRRRAVDRRSTTAGPNPTHRDRSGSKRHLLTDAGRVPLAVTVSAANKHDVISARPTIVGRLRTRSDALVADKAYDAKIVRAWLNGLGIRPLIPRRGDSSRGLCKVRWPIERNFAWLHQFAASDPGERNEPTSIKCSSEEPTASPGRVLPRAPS